VAEAFGATAALRDDPGLARIETPVLMLVAQADRLVDARAPARGGADAERHFGLFRPGCAHESARGRSGPRQRLAAIDAFLARRVGAPADLSRAAAVVPPPPPPRMRHLGVPSTVTRPSPLLAMVAL
jgi:hypothetical protein